MKRAGLFIPIYNEERILYKNILKIHQEIKKQKLKVNIYLVDDNSKDNSISKVRRLISVIPNLHYIRCKDGPSRRENLSKVMSKAKEKYILFMDLDLSTNIHHLKEAFVLLSSGHMIVIGNRYSKKSKLKRRLVRLLISRAYNLIINIFFDSKLKDHQCGFKGFERNTFKKIVRIMGYDKSKSRGWFWDAELLIIAKKMDIKIIELGVGWEESKKSSFNFIREIRMIPHIIFKLPKIMKKIKKN